MSRLTPRVCHRAVTSRPRSALTCRDQRTHSLFRRSHWPQTVTRKSERRQARETVAGYHEAQLAELVARVAEATDRFRNGELDAFDVDQVLLQYSRAAKELWKFCNTGDVELTARQAHEGLTIDWWERGAPTRGRPPANGGLPREPR